MRAFPNTVEALADFIHRYFIWPVLTSYLIAALLPDFGVRLRDIDLGSLVLPHSNLHLSVPPLLLSILLFNAGLGVRPQELKQLTHQPQLLLGGLLGNFVTPLGFIIGVSVLMRYWHNPEEVQQILVGLALVAAMPIAGASTAWTQNANGNLALSLGLILLTTSLSPLLTPFVLHTVGFVTTGDYSEDLHELASDGVVTFLGTWVVLPSLLGLAARWLLGEARLTRAKFVIKLVNYVILLLLNYSNAALTLPKVLSQPDFDFLAILIGIVVALCTLSFATGYLVARLLRANQPNLVSLMFGLGMNNNGAGLVLVTVSLTDHPQVMLPIIFYNLVQHLIASLVDFRLFHQSQAATNV